MAGPQQSDFLSQSSGSHLPCSAFVVHRNPCLKRAKAKLAPPVLRGLVQLASLVPPRDTADTEVCLGIRTVTNVSCFRRRDLEEKRLFTPPPHPLRLCAHAGQRTSAARRASKRSSCRLGGGQRGLCQGSGWGLCPHLHGCLGGKEAGVSALGRQGRGEVLLSAGKHLALSDLSLFGTRAECSVGGLLQQKQHPR